ncbi:MAG: hypothetical protein H7X95_06650, partial [Deltaproteobacteria bacterium]|nr:hypothetical protein [Deltaproteobacteria bacterium]
LATGSDIKRARAAGAPQNEEGLQSLRDKLMKLANHSPDAPPPDASPAALIKNVYAALAAAPSRVLLATLDDALAVEERPNIPGANSEWSNWSTALPVPIEDFESLELPKQIAQVLARRGAANESAQQS